MADCFVCYDVAKRKLETEMANLQHRSIHRDQSESSAVETEPLVNEIEDRRKAIEKLELKTCCDRCERAVKTPQLLRFRITHSPSMLTDLDVTKVNISAECEDCCRVATIDQIRCANMTIKQELDLEGCARRLIKKVENTCNCRLWGTSEDLLHEAYIQTLDGSKKWYPGHVDFFGHLLKAMENIAWRWRNMSYREVLEADPLKYDEKTGEEFSPFDIAKTETRADRRLIKRQELEQSLKAALVIEPENTVLRFIKHRLERDHGFKVIDISSAEEGLRQYLSFTEYIRFDLVVVSHLPNGVKLAMDIFRKNASQKMIITTTHVSEENVFRPVELSHVPILLKSFSRKQLHAVLQSEFAFQQ